MFTSMSGVKTNNIGRRSALTDCSEPFDYIRHAPKHN